MLYLLLFSLGVEGMSPTGLCPPPAWTPGSLPEQQLSEASALQDRLLELTLDPDKEREWVESFLSVPSEDEGIIPWKVTPQQDRIIHTTQRVKKLLIVKGRQTRCSTILMAKAVRKSLNTYGQNFVIITQTAEMTDNFRTFIKDRYRELAAFGFDCDPDNKDHFDMNNSDKLRLKGRRNTFHFASAEQKVGLRGIQTAHWVHASEVAHWDDKQARKIIGGLLPAVQSGNFYAESTPNGAAGWFYDKVKDSMPLVPESMWTTAFYPWWLEPKYTLSNPTLEDELRSAGLNLEAMRAQFQPTVQEETLMRREGLNLDQMLWRRLKTHDLMSTGQYFAQEYPEDLLSCWLASGVGFFHDDLYDHLTYYRERVKEPMVRLREKDYKDPVTGVMSMIDFHGANLLIYQPPIPGRKYCAFQDVSAGVAVDGDYSALVIADVETMTHVATLRVRTLPTRVGHMAAAACAYYNWAFLAVERNSYGVSALEALLEDHYPNLYYDVINQPQHPELGWYTSVQSRELMLNRFRGRVFDHTWDTCDQMMVLEMGGFTWKQVQGRTGNMLFRAEASANGNDDMVIASAGCAAIAPYAPNRIKSRGMNITVGPQQDYSGQTRQGDVYTPGTGTSMPWLGV